MYEKIIVSLITIIITLVRYIQLLPTRQSMMPGGELFIPLWVFILWALGHEFLHEIRRADKGGYGLNDNIED